MPDLLPPDYITGVRAERRQKLRDAVDGATAAFEQNAAAKQLDDNFKLAYKLMSSREGPRRVRAGEGAGARRSDRYGRTRFGQICLMARRLIEAGVRFVTVNMFETVFDEVTWDIHGSKPFTDIVQMSKEVAPNFDSAYTALLEDLERARAAVEHDGGGAGRVRPDAEGEPGRRARPPPRRVDDPDRRRPDQGRQRGRRDRTNSATPRRRGR